MPNFSNWAATDRASDAVRRINDKPSSIVIARGAIDLPAQTVRVEEDNTVSDVQGQGNTIASTKKVTVFGVRDHATVADTDIRKGDRFTVEGRPTIYKVQHVTYQTGEIQAICEATS